MILPIVRYGHPALRQRGASIDPITTDHRRLVADMFDTMYAAHGIGLAAQQVGQALRVTVLDVRGVEDRPSTLHIDGKPVDVPAFMPLVLINPELSFGREKVTGPEGCLSFPEMYADITRPESIEVSALGLDGRPLVFRCGGLLSKAIQHEVDHLNGILFIDRMEKESKAALKGELDQLMAETKAALEAKDQR
ncbi:MAG: peptide deformylase [Verrucomicrobiales bacterium]|nr:peptide deformylase [Verrucomicrobiales bacterium]